MNVMLQHKQNDDIGVPSNRGYQDQVGFTLIELMVVIFILSIIAAVGIPSYQDQVRKGVASSAEQEMQKIAEQLERYKAKNFTYRKFDPNYIYSTDANAPSLTEIILPLNATGSAIKYKITIRDLQDTTKPLTDNSAAGRGWSIQALAVNDPKNYNFLMTSQGLRCKNTSNITYTSCGSNSSAW